jgi:hypothetical protein
MRLADRKRKIADELANRGRSKGELLGEGVVEPGGIAPPSENAYRRTLRACPLLNSH